MKLLRYPISTLISHLTILLALSTIAAFTLIKYLPVLRSAVKKFAGKKVLLLGYGREGRATHRYLLKHCPEVLVLIADAKEQELIKESLPNTQTFFGENYLSALSACDVIVRTPGISLNTSLTAHTSALSQNKEVITSATKIFFEDCPGTVVGVSGTKGKSTTSSLIEKILLTKYRDVRLVGNIGKPMLDFLEGATEQTIFVAELSSYQLEDLEQSPHVAVLLNVVPEHLDHHGSFANYLQSKANLVNFQGATDITVFNPRNEAILELVNKTPSRKVNFFSHGSKDAGCYIRDGAIFTEEREMIRFDDLSLKGPGNLENVLAAISVGLEFGVSIEQITKVLVDFRPLAHRLEFIAKVRGVVFYNDSLATVPQATINALIGLGDSVETLIAGGFDRGLDYNTLGEFIANTKLKNLILFPSTGEKIRNAVLQAASSNALPKFFPVDSMEQAVQIAFTETAPDKICLLSPASSSFGLFRDYVERGETFKKAIFQ